MTTNCSDPSAVAVAEPVDTTAAVKDGSSTPETLTSDGAAPREPASEKTANPESPRPIHGTKVPEQRFVNPVKIKVI
jgi:hypothetical protein